MNMVSEQASHPLAMSNEALHVLVQWLKSNGTRQIREPDPRRIIIERYPAGLLSEAELQALWDVVNG